MDLMTFLKKYSIEYAKKDSKNDLSVSPVAPIIINTSSWNSRIDKLASFCELGTQMIQVTKMWVTVVPMMFTEPGRHHIVTLEGTITPPTQKALQIKWRCQYIRSFEL